MEPVWRTGRATGDLSRALAWIEPAKHLSAHLEGRDYLLRHRDYRAATRISSGACAAPLGREHAEAAHFNPVPLRQRIGDRVQDRIDDVCRVLLVEVRVLLGDLQDEFGLDHRSLWQRSLRGRELLQRTLMRRADRKGEGDDR